MTDPARSDFIGARVFQLLFRHRPISSAVDRCSVRVMKARRWAAVDVEFDSSRVWRGRLCQVNREQVAIHRHSIS